MQLDAILTNLQARVSEIPGARILVMNAPSIPGLGSTGGFTFEIQDLNGERVKALNKASANFINEAHKRPELTGVYTVSAHEPTPVNSGNNPSILSPTPNTGESHDGVAAH